MKAEWVVVVALLAAPLAGCSSAGTPNLLAPKAILSARPDGNATLFVHSAFGEHQYDWIAVALDNQTVENRTSAFSVELVLPAPHYFLDVSVGSGAQQYHMRGRVDVSANGEKALVAIQDEQDSWGDARSFSLPWEHIIDRKVTAG